MKIDLYNLALPVKKLTESNATITWTDEEAAEISEAIKDFANKVFGQMLPFSKGCRAEIPEDKYLQGGGYPAVWLMFPGNSGWRPYFFTPKELDSSTWGIYQINTSTDRHTGMLDIETTEVEECKLCRRCPDSICTAIGYMMGNLLQARNTIEWFSGKNKTEELPMIECQVETWHKPKGGYGR